MRISLLIFIFLLASCGAEKATLEQKGSHIIVKSSGIKITQAREIEWKLGIGLAKKVSRGFEGQFTIPLLENEDIELLAREGKIDSWLAKIVRITKRGRRETMGYIEIPNFAPRPRSQKKPIHPKYVSFRVDYTSHIVADKFTNKNCPPLGHRKRINDYDVTSSYLTTSSWVRAIKGELDGKVSMNHLRPEPLDGGSILAGEYFVELALFGSDSSMVYSNFEKVGGSIKIDVEDEIFLENCPAFDQQRPYKPNSNKHFRFGR